MRVGLLTREFPPEVYGGAGVHVEYLTEALAAQPGLDVDVYCFGGVRSSRLVRRSYEPWASLPPSGAGAALRAMATDLRMAADVEGADLVHSHTWYANFGGHLAKLLYGIPHVMTTHSLEPRRPWKEAQLGGGYAVSSYCERTAIESADAVIAVSAAMAEDVRTCYPSVDPHRVIVIHNGIDPGEYRPDRRADALLRLGIDPDRPSVMWIGRVTAQKGIDHLLAACPHVERDAQLILCAGAPDTPEIGREMRGRAEELMRGRSGVYWIEEMLPRAEVVQLLSHATVFVCPSVYEPFGLINLEAMACGVPVVATAVGGIPEIVVDGETGYLVPVVEDEPAPGGGLSQALAYSLNRVLGDPEKARRMGDAGRRRVLEHFTWDAVARQTADLYSTLLRR
jgi:alpha-maltose-1-phosphate synthase